MYLRNELKSLRDQAVRTRVGLALAVLNMADLMTRFYGGTDKAHHGYMHHYAAALGPKRFARNLLFEIGVGGADYQAAAPGGSLRLWRDYLMRSQIVGIDLIEKQVALGPRVHFRQADQGCAADLLAVIAELGTPNIVIDDGSHVGAHQWATFAALWPLMPAGAIYVVEDLSTSYYPDYGGGHPPGDTTGLGLARRLLEDAQSLDVTFRRYPDWGDGPVSTFPDVLAVHVFPGLLIAVKGDI